jgi:hypothetical protein
VATTGVDGASYAGEPLDKAEQAVNEDLSRQAVEEVFLYFFNFKPASKKAFSDRQLD